MNNIEYIPFLRVVADVTAHYNKINNEDYLSEGQFKIIDQGQNLIGGYTNNGELITESNAPVIVFGDHTKIFKYVDFPFAIGADGVKVFMVNQTLADPLYVYYFLKTIHLPEVGYSRHFKYLKNIKIPIISNTKFQRRIATVLSKAEELIKQRKESIALLDELLKSTFMQMFGDPIKNYKIWEKKELFHFGEIITGNTPPRSNAEYYADKFIEWIKTDNISDDHLYITTANEYLSEVGAEQGRIVKDGALLVACIAGSIESIGRAVLTNRNVAFNQQINAIQPNKGVSPFYLYWLFRISRKYIQNQATKGMKKILTKGEFEKIKMIKPPLDIQIEFTKIAEKIVAIKIPFKESLVELENLYGSLSQRAFKGELDLSKVPDYQFHLPVVEEETEIETFASSLTKEESEELLKAKTDEERINILNTNLEAYYNNIPHSGAPNEIDHKLRQLDIELKERGEIPYWDQYIRYRIIKNNFNDKFTFHQLWDKIRNFPFVEKPTFSLLKELIINSLEGENSFLKQEFDKNTEQIIFRIKE